MADLQMSARLSREYLGLVPLELNDEVKFKVGKQFLGGSQDWERVTAKSTYMDGEKTTQRTKQMVSEPAQVEIFGRATANQALNVSAMKDNHDDLVDAVSQNDFTLTVTIDGTTWRYQCEASGWTMTWDGPRFMARQGQMTLALRRQPNAI